jgi:hypothetical protein
MVHGIRAHSQFCLPKMALLYIQTLPLLPEDLDRIFFFGRACPTRRSKEKEKVQSKPAVFTGFQGWVARY